MKGNKKDSGKNRLELLSVPALLGMGRVMTQPVTGPKAKYAPRDWEKGIEYSRYYAATLRHLLAWFNGEDIDPESGESHLDHAACCCMILSHFEKEGPRLDDRPRKAKRCPS